MSLGAGKAAHPGDPVMVCGHTWPPCLGQGLSPFSLLRLTAALRPMALLPSLCYRPFGPPWLCS